VLNVFQILSGKYSINSLTFDSYLNTGVSISEGYLHPFFCSSLTTYVISADYAKNVSFRLLNIIKIIGAGY
jgi:hypothetical protein